jgi:hypothetical protein
LLRSNCNACKHQKQRHDEKSESRESHVTFLFKLLLLRSVLVVFRFDRCCGMKPLWNVTYRFPVDSRAFHQRS